MCDVFHVIVMCGLIQTLVNLFILGSSRLTHLIFLRLQYSGDTFSTSRVKHFIALGKILVCAFALYALFALFALFALLPFCPFAHLPICLCPF